jgi:hypothetical protein
MPPFASLTIRTIMWRNKIKTMSVISYLVEPAPDEKYQTVQPRKRIGRNDRKNSKSFLQAKNSNKYPWIILSKIISRRTLSHVIQSTSEN